MESCELCRGAICTQTERGRILVRTEYIDSDEGSPELSLKQDIENCHMRRKKIKIKKLTERRVNER